MGILCIYQAVDTCGSCISGAGGLSPSMDLLDLHVTILLARDSGGAGMMFDLHPTNEIHRPENSSDILNKYFNMK